MQLPRRHAYLSQYFAHLQDVLYLQGDRNYTFLVLKNGQKVLFARTMGHLLAQLPENTFVRISKGQAVNAACIQSVCFSCSYSYVSICTGECFTISRRRATELRQHPPGSLGQNSSPQHSKRAISEKR